jgi:hypothetical protein
LILYSKTFILITQQDLSCIKDHKTTGRAIDEIYILAAEDQGPKSCGIAIQLETMEWSQDYIPPLFTDVLRLFCSTSQVLTNNYTTTE